MSLRSFEHALARLQKVFELLDGAATAPFAVATEYAAA